MKVIKVFGKIFAVIFCIGYFFILYLLMTISFATNLLSGNYYSNILNDTDLKKIKVSELDDILDDDDLNLDPNDSVEDALVSYITASGIDETVAKAIIENEEIRDIAGTFIGDYINYQVGGEKPKIKRSDVKTLLNNPDVMKALKVNPTEDDIDKIYNQLNDLVDEMMEGVDYENDDSKRIENNYIDF